MPKANLTLPDGTKVTIEGDPEEVARLLQMVSGSSEKTRQPRQTTKATRGKRTKTQKPKGRGEREAAGPLAYIRQIKKEGFFKQKRTLSDVQKTLETRGYIYPVTSLSGPLLSLVRSRELGRLKEEGVWKYVHR